MAKRVWATSGGLLLAGLGGLAWWLGAAPDPRPAATLLASAPALQVPAPATPPGPSAATAWADALVLGRLSVNEGRQRLAQDCPRQRQAECEAAWLAALGRLWGETDPERVRALLTRYETHEQALRSFTPTGTAPTARWQALWQQHVNELGPELAERLYGRQRALAEYRQQTAALLSESTSLAPADRLARWQAITEATLGRYGQELVEQLGPYDRYDTGRALLSVGAAPDPAALTALRAQLFPAEAAARLAAQEAERDRQQAQVAEYQRRLAALQAQYAVLPNYAERLDYRTALEALRREVFAAAD